MRDSSDADIDALIALGQRLQGFEGGAGAEWIDGALTALMAGPSVPDDPVAALQPLLGDAWARTFADPADASAASATMQARWRVLRRQLDPEALFEQPDALQLAPLLLEPDAAAGFALGADWAAGFLAVVASDEFGWAAADDAVPDALLAPLQALHDATDGDRETMVDAAAFTAQDLRLWWVEHAPRTAPRRVKAVPGRNDPCPCGSGRKFKKCHGAA